MKLYNTFKKATFAKIFKGIGDEIMVATMVVICLTILLSLAFYFFEKDQQPDTFGNWYNVILWGFFRYFESGIDIYNGAPMTGWGIAITILLGLIGLALVGVPTGLFVTGFTEAMQEQTKDERIERYYKIMRRRFHVSSNGPLNKYIENIKKTNPSSLNWCEDCKFHIIPDNIPIADFVLDRINIDDILDTCERHPEFRVENEATIDSIEDRRTDRFMLEHFPVNRKYGYFKNRNSKVTIVSTSSHSHIGIGNFSYYVAKFAGLNYISKEFDVADGESWLKNDWDEPAIEGIKKKDLKRKPNKKEQKIYNLKQEMRNEFLTDLESVCKAEGSWVICLNSHVKNSQNTADIYVSHQTKINESAIDQSQLAVFNQLIKELTSDIKNSNLKIELENSTHISLTNDPEDKRNLLFKLREDNCQCNGFLVSISTKLIGRDVNKRVVQFILANAIHHVIVPGQPLEKKEIEDMNRSNAHLGFADQEIDKVKDDIIKMREE